MPSTPCFKSAGGKASDSFSVWVGIFTVTTWSKPTPWVSGYDRAAARMVEVLPENGRVVFSGNRDGSFIFNIRADESRSDITVIRADKLFLGIAIQAEHGLNERQYNKDEIIGRLNELGIHYVVAVPGTWQEAEVMRNFYEVLESDAFTTVERIALAGDTRHKEVIYRNQGQLKQPPDDFAIDLPAVNMKIGSDDQE